MAWVQCVWERSDAWSVLAVRLYRAHTVPSLQVPLGLLMVLEQFSF
jgi:hypothetical protein